MGGAGSPRQKLADIHIAVHKTDLMDRKCPSWTSTKAKGAHQDTAKTYITVTPNAGAGWRARRRLRRRVVGLRSQKRRHRAGNKVDDSARKGGEVGGGT